MIVAAPSQKWVWWGDSITAVYVWFTAVQAAIVAYYTALFGSGDSRIPTFSNGAINGGTITDIDNNYSTIFSAQAPDVCVGLIGVNGAGEPVNDYIGKYEHILSKIRSERPHCQFGICPIVMIDEQWRGTLPYNTFDPILDAKRTALQQLAQTYGATFIDFRTMFWTNVPIYNPNNDQTGHLSIDGIHPTPTMIALMGSLALANITMSPTAYTPVGYVVGGHPPWTINVRWVP